MESRSKSIISLNWLGRNALRQLFAIAAAVNFVSCDPRVKKQSILSSATREGITLPSSTYSPWVEATLSYPSLAVGMNTFWTSDCSGASVKRELKEKLALYLPDMSLSEQAVSVRFVMSDSILGDCFSASVKILKSPASFALSFDEVTVKAGSSILATVKALNSDGSLTSNFNGRVSVFSTGDATSVIVNLSDGVGAISISNKRPESVQVSLGDVDGTGATVPDSTTLTFQHGSATVMKLHGLRRLLHGICGVPLIVSLEDANGSDAVLEGSLSVSLNEPTSLTTFYSDASCTTPISSVSIPAGDVRASVYVRSTAKQNISITASGRLGSSSRNVMVAPAVSVNAVTGTSLKAGQTAQKLQINFLSDVVIPSNGQIRIGFPPEINVSSAAYDSKSSRASGLDTGTMTCSPSGQVVTCIWSGTADAMRGAHSITLNSIVMPASASGDLSVSVEILDGSNNVIQPSSESTPFRIVASTNAVLTGIGWNPMSHTAWDPRPSALGKHTTKFTTATSLPADGKIRITFPSGFDVSGAQFSTFAADKSTWDQTGFVTTIDGQYSVAISGQIVTVTRSGSGSASAAGAKVLTLDNIRNNSTASSWYSIIVETLNASDTVLDGPTLLNFSITEGRPYANTPSNSPGYNPERTAMSKFDAPEYPTFAWANTSVSGFYVAGQLQADDGSSTRLPEQTIIGPNGEIMGAASGSGGKKKLVGIDHAGRILFEQTPRGPVYTGSSTSVLSPAYVDELGTYYFTEITDTGFLVQLMAIDSKGMIEWDLGWADNPGGNATMTADHRGNLFVKGAPHSGAGLSTIFGVDGIWRARADLNNWWQFTSYASVGSDNTIYSAGRGNKLNAFNPDGTYKWYNHSISNWFASPVLKGNKIYATSYGTGNSFLRILDGLTGSSLKLEMTMTMPSHCCGQNAIGDSIIVAVRSSTPYIELFSSDGSNLGSIYTPYKNTPVSLTASENILHNLTNTAPTKNVVLRTKTGDFKWSVAGVHNGLIGGDKIVIAKVFDGSTRGVAQIRPWTLSASSARRDSYRPGEDVVIIAKSSMLAKHPFKELANKVQLIVAGKVIAMQHIGRDADGDSLWRGVWSVPRSHAGGVENLVVEAAAVDVVTDIKTHFEEEPSGSCGTGLTSPIEIKIEPHS